MLYPYIINDDRIKDMYEKCKEERKVFIETCNMFAKTYDASAEIHKYGREAQFYGIVFDNPKTVDYEIWTKPHGGVNISRVRESKQKVSLREKVQQAKYEYNIRINDFLSEYKKEIEGSEHFIYCTNLATPFMKEIGIGSNEWVNYEFKQKGENLFLLVDRKIDKDFVKELYVSEYKELINVK